MIKALWKLGRVAAFVKESNQNVTEKENKDLTEFK